MNLSLGVDLVNIPRFTSIIGNERVKMKLFAQSEFHLSTQSLAGNFAVKEAFIKAFAGTLPIFDFWELEVLRDSNGAPMLKSENSEVKVFISRVVSLSISHDIDYCVGVVLVNNLRSL